MIERRIDRMLCDAAEVRNKERKLLGKVLSSNVMKRGGLTKERTSKYTYQHTFSPALAIMLITRPSLLIWGVGAPDSLFTRCLPESGILNIDG